MTGEGDEPSGGSADVVVSLDGVTKRFGEVAAVDHFTLQIRRGEFFSLLGPSGCGKTTTLRLIGGFEHPDAGTIRLGGKDVTRIPPYRRNVNTVFQSYALFPHLSVFDNVAYGLKRRGLSRADIAPRVSEMLELVALAGFDHRRPAQLSGGQQQRVALARALVNRPDLLLLDEPLGALDLKLRRQMQYELKRIQSEVGITFLYVTHDQEEAMTMSDRIAVMKAGNADQIGAPQEVYDRPATEFVAGFLGASNLLNGTVEGTTNVHARIKLDSGDVVRIPIEALRDHEDTVRIGVRPEKIRLVSGTAPRDDNVVKASLLTSTFVGVNYTYTAALSTGETITIYAQNIGNPTQMPFVTGQEVVLAWHPEHTFAVPSPS